MQVTKGKELTSEPWGYCKRLEDECLEMSSMTEYKRLAKVDLIVIDDIMLFPERCKNLCFDSNERNILMTHKTSPN